MSRQVKISPSFLSADFLRLEDQIQRVEESGSEYIHLDVMDGHFVPNLTFGPMLVKAIRTATDLVLDVHLMISHPGAYLDAFAESGADIFTFHIEAVTDCPPLIRQIKNCGMKAGATLKPATSVSKLVPLLPQLDLALVMSVEPGFGGQAFMPESLEKVRILRKEIDSRGLDTEIEIDGGIGVENAGTATSAGVDVLVAGSAAFRDGRVVENVAALREAAEAGTKDG